MIDPWPERMRRQIAEVLAKVDGKPERMRTAVMNRACPFKRGSRLYAAWWCEAREQRLARGVEQVEEK